MNKRKLIKSIISGGIILTLPELAFAEPEKGKDTANALNVEIAGVVVPIASGRRLVNYCFMRIMVAAADFKSADILRANDGLVRDAIVRATSKNPIPLRNPPNYFDKKAFANQIFPIVSKSLIGIRIKRIWVTDAQLMRH